MNVSSVKNLNGESFSAVQDAALTDFVSSNSASWTGGGGTTYTSPSGTILIRGNTLEATNSGVYTIFNEGFVSSFETKTIGPEDVPGTVAKFSWDEPSPNTMFNFDLNWNDYNDAKVIYSANTNLTGEITLPIGSSTNLITIPNATALDIWCNSYWLSIENNIASAADRIETVVCELVNRTDFNNLYTAFIAYTASHP